MSSGIRVTVGFDAPDGCPIAGFSAETGQAVDSTSTSVSTSEAGCVTEFAVESDSKPTTEDWTPVFSYGSTHRYRFSHEREAACPCECLGQFDCPVERYAVRDGVLTLVFNAPDYQQLQDVVADLRENFPEMDVRRLVRSSPEGPTRDTVLVDRGKLTERQAKVLQTAYDMGYFERPRRANKTEIAAELDIATSTFTEHLAAAQLKLLGDVLEDGSSPSRTNSR
ncbi:MAG: helix-turn-helix domain-containing protein [Salinigranum sp.]